MSRTVEASRALHHFSPDRNQRIARCYSTPTLDHCVLVHPLVGVLLVDETQAYDVAEDVGHAFDLNEIGTLKSRVTLCWL
jgi:hypothetical protein